jgi:hypothetical protein
MKSVSVFFLAALLGLALFGQETNNHTSAEAPVIHISTALDHLSVLEFGEPVTMAAVGSTAFSVEWRENKVLIKPLKAGSSTDLFVWTASRRFAYELDPPGEVTHMSFAIDTSMPRPKPTPDASEQINSIADMVLTRALVREEPIDHNSVKDKRGRIVVRVESVFVSRNTTYIRYSVSNLTARPYRIGPASLRQLPLSALDLGPRLRRRKQLSDETAEKAAETGQTPLQTVASEIQNADLAPGGRTQGVIAVRQQFSDVALLQLSLPNTGDQHVTATFLY